MMSYLNYIIKKPRFKKKKLFKSLKLNGNPQKLAVCLRILTVSPKKPNSANRRIVKANIIEYNTPLFAKIPGESHLLQQHSIVLLRGAKIRDLIGVSYCAIRGKFDLNGVINRKTSRSRYGVKSL